MLVLGLLLTPAPAHAVMPHMAKPASAEPACPSQFDARASTARFVVAVRLPFRAEGHFPQVTGVFRLLADGACEVDVELDASTIVFDGPEWLAKLTRSPAFLDVEAHPRARFVSTAFPLKHLNEGGPLHGRLTLRGRERDVEFRLSPASCATPGHGCPLRVMGELSRKSFGMQAHRLTVKDAVRIEFLILLEPSP